MSDPYCQLPDNRRNGGVEWQPIETAPKDGSRFLACCVDPEDFAAGDPDPYDFIEIISGPFHVGGVTKWLNQSSGNYTSLKFDYWRPMLPPPPSKPLSENTHDES